MLEGNVAHSYAPPVLSFLKIKNQSTSLQSKIMMYIISTGLSIPVIQNTNLLLMLV